MSDYSIEGLKKPQKYLSENFMKKNYKFINKLQPKKGSILFSKDGSIGIAYHLTEDLNGITSGAILHLKIKDNVEIPPEYLTLVLNSKLTRMQAERDAGGSVIMHWLIRDIENVLIPIISYKKQLQIADLIEKSFKLKEQSENLLEIAKRAVEIAIEQKEESALAYIEKHDALNCETDIA